MEISPKYDPKCTESRVLSQWLDKGHFTARVNSRKNPFSIVIPPPNITGILHMGHALNNTIQDVLIRFKRMQGNEALWMPGTDHAGIATQNIVEKDLSKKGLRKEDIGRDEFSKVLWAWRDKYGSTIIDQLKRLGSSCDWTRVRFTMDDGYSEAVKETFIKLYKKGLIYRGNYIINWCPRCKTALSDEEAVRRETDGWLYYIKYPVVKKTDSSKGEDYVIVATTRPETMLGDTAVAINPKDQRYEWLKTQEVTLPIVERTLRVVTDKVIDPEFGTGVVKVTPAHDPVDFMLGKKHNLEFINIMNPDATLNKCVPDDFIGMDRFEARAALLEVLAEKKLLVKKQAYKISAGNCYRCHTVVEPRMSLQWFVKMKPLAKKAIKVVEKNKVSFYPQRWKKVYLNWMNNIHDWCISRQIWWGHRLPVWYCKDCKQKNKEQIIVSKTTPVKCPKCKSTDLYQDEDVLDTWFSSWLWPFATFGWPNKSRDLKYFYPTNCLITASEILFFWVARMIMAGLEFRGKIPFKDVIIHGTVRDEKGVKMSKSLGNTIDPLVIIDKFGADALRFSLMLLAASGSDVYLNEEKFLVGRNFSNKIWNATRFIFLKINENDIVIDNLNLDNLNDIDKWIITEVNNAIKGVTGLLDKYSLNDATKTIYDFFWHQFCDWYIEIVKDNFTIDRAKVSIYVLINSLKLLHPIMPFITEEVFSLVKKNTELELPESIVKSSWPIEKLLKTSSKELKELNLLFETIKELRNIKADLGLAQKRVGIEVKTSKASEQLWEKNLPWIKRLTSSSEIKLKQSLSRILFENNLWALNLDIPSTDMSVFLASLSKRVSGLEGVLAKSNGRLGNDKFLKNASKEVIANEKKKADDVLSNLKRLRELKNVFKSK